jgi:O-antigen/teichoic acid export membrane protein
VFISNAITKLTTEGFFGSVAKIIGGNFLTSIISLVTSVFIARWTSPYELGSWNLVLLVSVYAPIIQFGVFNGLNRELPYFTGKGENEAALHLARASYAWCLVLSLVSAAVTAAFALYYWTMQRHDKALTALAIGVIVVCLWPAQYLTVTYRTSSDFGRLAGRNSVVALIGVPLTLLVFWFGYVGLMARAVLLAVLGVVALYFRRPVAVLPKWDGAALVQLARIGLPIWVLGQLGIFFLTLDRIVLSSSPLALGFLSISIQASTFAGMIPIAITMVLYPQMVQKYGSTHSAMEALKIVNSGAALATGLGALTALCGWLLVPVFIELLLPAYAPGTRAAQWACLTGLAMGLSVYNNIFNVIRRQDLYLISLTIGLAVFFGAWFGLTRQLGQAPLESAVQSLLAANLAMSVASAILSRLACLHHDRKAAISLAPSIGSLS